MLSNDAIRYLLDLPDQGEHVQLSLEKLMYMTEFADTEELRTAVIKKKPETLDEALKLLYKETESEESKARLMGFDSAEQRHQMIAECEQLRDALLAKRRY